MLDLLDYRRHVAEIYRAIREQGATQETWMEFTHRKDELVRNHSQSALDHEQKSNFKGLSYFDYDPAYRVIVPLEVQVDPQEYSVDLGDDGLLNYRRIGKVKFELPTGVGELGVFWLMGYGGGLFLPFGDTTNRSETYGGGRYLYDTIKGADLGATLTDIVLDFNYAYNPSCAYNPRWVCPLAPLENRLTIPVFTGEKQFHSSNLDG